MSIEAAFFLIRLAELEVLRFGCESFVGVIVSRTINDMVV